MGSGKDWIPHSRPLLGDAEAAAAQSVVLSGFVGHGERVSDFETAISRWVGQTQGIAVQSGSAALQLALLANGVHQGDEVILPAFVCRAVLNAVLAAGGVPILADVDEKLMVTRESVAAVVTRKTKAVIAVHMFGASAPIRTIQSLGIPVVEDAASSFGSEDQVRLGSMGDSAILSFSSTKMITTGAGGMLLTSKREVADTARELIDYDAIEKVGSRAGTRFNFAMTDLQAAVGLVQFSRMESFIERRRKISAQYLESIESSARLSPVHDVRRKGFCPYRFVLRTSSPSAGLIGEFKEAGIDCRGAVGHFLPDYLGQPRENFPGLKLHRDHLISVPIYPALTDEEVSRVCSVLRKAAH